MKTRLSFIFATLALSAGAAFGQEVIGPYAIGYAANLNIGDSILNLSNAGDQGGFVGATFGNGAPAPTIGNICINVYTFDAIEEEIACCACLVTPNGLDSLSAKAGLISNPLAPAIPTSIVVKLVASEPGIAAGAFTQCNPATVVDTPAGVPYYASPAAAAGDPAKGSLALEGMLSWGTTLEPSGTPGTYRVVNVPYLAPVISPNGNGISPSEIAALTSTCHFIQSDGSGFGICKSCQTGALAGAKK